MTQRLAHQLRASARPPLPVRLVDMQSLEARYEAAEPDDRMSFHVGLAFYSLLTDEERFALERRYPNELLGEPGQADATEGTRVTWDLRSRELIVCMLQYGDKLLQGHLDLVRAVEPDEDAAIFAMTATGSFLEIERPAADGTRPYTYRGSARRNAELEDGVVKLREPVRLGNRVVLGDRRTSEILFLAAGPMLPPDDDSLPGRQLLFGPIEDETRPQALDWLRVGSTRFRVLVDALENTVGEARIELQDRLVLLAASLQKKAAPEGGHRLTELAWFTTGSGARYDVMNFDSLDLVRHGADDAEPVSWLHDAWIPEQQVVPGAPLVIFHAGVRNAKQVAFVFKVDEVGPLIPLTEPTATAHEQAPGDAPESHGSNGSDHSNGETA